MDSPEEPVEAPAPAAPAAPPAEAAPPLVEERRRVGEIVWARSPGYSIWPGTVACPSTVRARAPRGRDDARSGAARASAGTAVALLLVRVCCGRPPPTPECRSRRRAQAPTNTSAKPVPVRYLGVSKGSFDFFHHGVRTPGRRAGAMHSMQHGHC
jgi:hypothetical protein